MNRKAVTMPGHAYALSWKQSRADRRDADAMRAYAMGKEKLHPIRRMMILSGLAGFNRNVTGD